MANKKLVVVGTKDVIKVDSNLVEVPEAMKFNKESKSGRQTKEAQQKPHKASRKSSRKSPETTPSQPTSDKADQTLPSPTD